MLVGRPPFEGDTPLSIAVQHLQSPPPDLAELRPDVPPELCDIVAKLLAKKVSDRYRTAADLLRDLRALRIEGAEFHLPLEADALPDELADTIADGSASSGLAATRELQVLMQTQAMMTVRKPRRVWPLLALLAAMLAGGFLARVTWSGPLLWSNPEETAVAVEQLDTAQEQFIHGVLLGSVEGLQSVAKYHSPAANPENEYWSRRALHQLAMLYLDNFERELSYRAFTQLAEIGPSEREFYAIGLAGQAVIHDQRDEVKPLSEKLPLVWKHRDQLDPELRERLEAILSKRGIDVGERAP
jgi:serine/threonine-protein kinase